MDVVWTAPGPGRWAVDRSHMPSGTTPMVQSVMSTAMTTGTRRVFQELGAPLDAIDARFVHGQLATLGEAGMMGANLPDQYGGGGISAPALLRAVSIVARACGSTASALTAHYLATDSILLGGTEAQKQALLPPAAEGRALGAFALTEPTAGSDPADMKTRARRVDGGWRLEGAKCFISNGGVADFLVVYAVTEQKQIKSIAFKGNKDIDTKTLQETVDVAAGQSIDRFRIAIATQAIEALYREKNHPYAHVNVPPDPLTRGELVFDVVEGPEVRVRKVDFKGVHSFTHGRLLDQVKTRSWIWIFRPGTYDPEQVEGVSEKSNKEREAGRDSGCGKPSGDVLT